MTQITPLLGALGAPVRGAAPAGETASGFTDTLKTAVRDFADAQRGSERAVAAHAQGKASMVDVIAAVSRAEVSLQAVITVRDRVVQAYQEVLRSPI